MEAVEGVGLYDQVDVDLTTTALIESTSK